MIVWRSQPIIPYDNEQSTYQGSFVIAPYTENIDESSIISLIEESYFVGQNIASDNTSLASMLPEAPKKNTFYDLVDLVGKPYNRWECPVKYQCVSFVEQMMGREFNANAKDIPVNENQPCEGCGIVFWGGRYGHIAYILEVESPSMLLVEQNRLGCGLVSTRSVSFEELNNVKGFVK